MTTTTIRPHRIAGTARRAVTNTRAAIIVLTIAAVSGIDAHPAGAATHTADVPPPCGPLAIHQPIPLPASTTPAAPTLRRLATHLTAEAADTQRGRYTRIGVTMTAADSSIGDCVTTVTRHATETRWRDELADSGTITGVGWYSDPEPAPAPSTAWYGPGELPGVLPGRVPADPTRLAAALDQAYPPDGDELAARVRAVLARTGYQQAADGTASRVDAIGALAAWHQTPRPARRAILQVLADVPGLTYHGRINLAGQAGIAVSVAARQHTTRYVLLLDEATGQVHAAEYVLTDPVIGRNLAVQVPYSMSRIVMTPQARTAKPGTTRDGWVTTPAG
ncbi:hypothetical protein DMB66_21165 [Actinoplanes sp. ATCC 53533]|uniref:hypothetical protein n=1 Tax=Actinoplanes sp. ATCC 53533 TaxID=1288362 RepID=UPI000F76696B|nr:hypothetical protein [Actinoplanes sp. ATCC 53533]RSM64025.1 hypothetical protein DMB66_21165 [Actinoplanes sp. ATCC 53533]